MKNLHDILAGGKYKKIKFKITKTNHLLVSATINGIKGKFILDTGASNSCVDFDNVGHFKLHDFRLKNTGRWPQARLACLRKLPTRMC